MGGFSLGLERSDPAFHTVAFCEREAYPQAVLKKNWPEIPIYDDVRTIPTDRLGRIDIVTGGYPCQPFSVAGKQLGKEDDRHLWPEMARIIRQCNPTWVLAENVAGHITMGLDEVLSDLEGQGYSARPFVIPACAIGAPHRRDRVWIIAHNDRQHRSANEREPNAKTDRRHKFGGICEDVPDTKSNGNSQQTRKINATGSNVSGRQTEVWLKSRRRGEDVADTSGNGLQGQWEDRGATGSVGLCGRARSDKVEDIREATKRGELEPCLGGSLDGVSAWLDGSWEDGIPRVSESEKGRAERLKGLGNAVVPQIVEQIGRAIIEAEYAI